MSVYVHGETCAQRADSVESVIRPDSFEGAFWMDTVEGVHYVRVYAQGMDLFSLEWYIINCYRIGLSVKWLWSLCAAEISRMLHEYVPGLSLGAS